MKCECEDWKDLIPIMNGYFFHAMDHGFKDWTHKCFQFCPWCGTSLEEELVSVIEQPGEKS